MNDLSRVALDASVRIALVASCVGAILMALRVRSGAVRNAGWTAVLCAMLLMPVLPNLTPGIGVRVPEPIMMWNGDAPPGVSQTPPVDLAAEPGPTATPPREGGRLARPQLPVAVAVWPGAVLALYLAGVLLLLTRMGAGWYAARRLARAAESISMTVAGVRVYESADIVTPLLVGVLDPRILLPRTWTGWPAATLRAVLAHETAHLRRRDSLVALGAGLNRCVFWFHPLAWWLQRELAATAEQACDEAGVRAIGQNGDYAEVLLEMAEAVRRQGGRLVWQGIGMYGTGSLQQRIHRILNGDAARAVPLRHKALVAVGCAAAIFIGAACRVTAKPESTAIANSAARSLADQESYRLGGFYAAILMRLPEAYQLSKLAPAEYSAWATEIRRKLDGSKDLTLLLETGSRLVAWGKFRQKAAGADFDLFGLGKTLVQRALQIEPKSAWAHQLLNVAADQELLSRLPENLWQGPLESRRQVIQSLPEGERFRELTIVAIAACDEAVRAEKIRHDEAAAKTAWQQAGKYAREAMDVAVKAQSDPDYGTAFFYANMVLGMAAIQGGDPKGASAFLLKAAAAPVTEALKYPIPNGRPWIMNWRFPSTLSAALLKAGERDAVVAFLEKYARITVVGRDRCLEDAALIRQGKAPSWAGI